MSKIEINKIEIKVGKKTIRMSMEQALGMQAELNRVFPVAAIYYPYIVPSCPCPQPYFPTYPEITWTTHFSTQG